MSIIKRWDRSLYPVDWEIISLYCRALAGWRCQRCGRAEGDELVSHAGKTYKIRLAACHADPCQAKSDPQPLLLCLCPLCHYWYDAPYRKKALREMDQERYQLSLQASVI